MQIKAPKPAIYLHIERLVVRGLPDINAAVLSAALTEALRRELSSTQSLHSFALPLAHTTVTLPVRCDGEQLGGALAQTLAGVVGAHKPTDSTRRDTPQGGRHG